MERIQVMLVDPHPLSREGLTLLLHGETYNVISATTTLDAAYDEIELGLRPALLLLVLEGSREEFESATLLHIRGIVPECKVVVIANSVSSSLLTRAVDAGVNACLLGDMSTEVLTHSLQLVMLGQRVFPAPASVLPSGADDNGQSAAGDRYNIEAPGLISMSGREGEILRTLLYGYSNKMIARELNISEATVKVHLKTVLRKLNVRNRTQAAIWAMANDFSERKSASMSLSAPNRSEASN